MDSLPVKYLNTRTYKEGNLVIHRLYICELKIFSQDNWTFVFLIALQIKECIYSCTVVQIYNNILWFSWFLWSVYTCSTSFVSCPTFKLPDIESYSSFLVCMNHNHNNCHRIPGIWKNVHQLYLSIFGYCCHLFTIFWEWQSCWYGLTLKSKNMVNILCRLQFLFQHFWKFFFPSKNIFPGEHHLKID